MKSGFVAIIGKPNAGKSTLLNNLLGEKLAITTHKAQTTRNAILGIYNKKDIQIVFIDTPGVHKPSSSLGTYMNKEAYAQAAGVDVIYYLVDGNKGLQNDDADILKQLFSYEVPVFLLLNKIDELSDDLIISRLAYANANYKFDELIPISGKNKENFDELLDTTINYLKDDVLYYPSNITNTSNITFQISEIIREKVILNTSKEVPHLVACRIDSLKENTSKVYIDASIICNKTSHKAIIIGKSGSMLKKINSSASKDIAALFDGKKIYLSLFVKVEEDWINKQKQLFDLGYFSGDKNE